jgi:hypothetical protein
MLQSVDSNTDRQRLAVWLTMVLTLHTFSIVKFVNNTKGRHCYLFLATVVTRTRCNFTLYYSVYLVIVSCAHKPQGGRKSDVIRSGTEVFCAAISTAYCVHSEKVVLGHEKH